MLILAVEDDTTKTEIQVNQKTANKHGAWSAAAEVRKGAAQIKRRFTTRLFILVNLDTYIIGNLS